MGRIYNKIKESSQKTYSKAFINHDKAQLRKPLPKFENLFLKNKNLKQSSFSLVDQDVSNILNNIYKYKIAILNDFYNL